MQKEKKKTIIMIVGFGHSGSTLLDKVLGNHTQGFSGGELVNYSKLSLKNDIYCGCSKPYSDCDFWQGINSELTRERKISMSEIPTEGNTHVSITRGRYFFRDSLRHIINVFLGYKIISKKHKETLVNTKILYEEIFNRSGCSFIVDSSKNLNRAIYLRHWLKDDFDFKFIHLLRDGRAVLSSFHRKEIKFELENKNTGKTTIHTKPKKQLNPKTVIWKWVLQNIYINGYTSLINKKNSFFLRYEDFTNTPEETIYRIFNKFNIPLEKEAVDISSNFNHMIGGHAARVNAKSIRKSSSTWNEVVPKPTKQYFNTVAGWLNKRYRYKNDKDMSK